MQEMKLTHGKAFFTLQQLGGSSYSNARQRVATGNVLR